MCGLVGWGQSVKSYSFFGWLGVSALATGPYISFSSGLYVVLASPISFSNKNVCSIIFKGLWNEWHRCDLVGLLSFFDGGTPNWGSSVVPLS